MSIENSDEESLLPQEKLSLHDRLRKSFVNTMEYWTLWLGFLWYLWVLAVNLIWKSTVSQWDDIQSLGNWLGQFGNISGLLLLISGTMLSVHIVHSSLGVKIHVSSYLLVLVQVLMAKIIGNYRFMKKNGFGESVWCIIIGCLCRTIFPKFTKTFLLKRVFSLEFFIKVGIVLLAINLKTMLEVGLGGLFVAWLETCFVLLVSFYIGLYVFKMDSRDSIVTASGLSVCGSSAAMAISEAVSADIEMTSSLVAIMSIFTVPLIPLLPLFGSMFGFSDIVSGAWIGGCVDSTGAVSASAFLGGTGVLQFAIIIKMFQNIIIGPLTLVITSFWLKSLKPRLLWDKFPKFVLGFILVGLITTLLPSEVQKGVIENSFIASEWWSSISFVLIGCDIDIWNIGKQFNERKFVLSLYLIGQTIDIFTTLGSSYLMFDVLK